MCPARVFDSKKAAPAPAEPSAPAPADADVPVCIDFLKGRCTRSQCRFLHPDLSQYEQLSGAVHARAGRRVCEVWAMTGQCKFGAKCNRLHPSVVVSQQPQPTMTMLLPLAAVPQPVLMAPLEAPAAPPALMLPPQPAVSSGWASSPTTPTGFFNPVPQVSVGRPFLVRQPLALWPPVAPSSGLQLRDPPVTVPRAFPPQFTPLAAPSVSVIRPQHVMMPPAAPTPDDEFQQLVRSILLMNLREKPLHPCKADPTPKGQAHPCPDDSRAVVTDLEADSAAEQPSPTGTQNFPAAQNSQSQLDHMLLEMLRNLHSAGVQSA